MSRITDPLHAQRMKQIQHGMVKTAYTEALYRSGFVGDQSQALRAFDVYRQAAATDESLQGVQAAVDWTYRNYHSLFATQVDELATEKAKPKEKDYSPRLGSQRAPIGSSLRDFLKTTATRAVKLRRGM